jgi:hypothetical protein
MSTKNKDDNRRELLLAAFGGNVQGWEYVEMVDAGEGATMSLNPPRCPCGHAIRFICKWEHKDGRKAHTGNVCVDTIPELGSEVFTTIKEDTKKFQKIEVDKKREAKKASDMADIHELRIKVLSESDSFYKMNIDTYNSMGSGWLGGAAYSRREGWLRVGRKVKEAMAMKSISGKRTRLEQILNSFKLQRKLEPIE